MSTPLMKSELNDTVGYIQLRVCLIYHYVCVLHTITRVSYIQLRMCPIYHYASVLCAISRVS